MWQRQLCWTASLLGFYWAFVDFNFFLYTTSSFLIDDPTLYEILQYDECKIEP
jgi:hypothetical protein